MEFRNHFGIKWGFVGLCLLLLISQSLVFGETPAREKYYTGCTPASEAQYASFPEAPDLRADFALPQKVDLTRQFPPPGNQGKQNSCVAWATAYAYKSFQENRKRHWGITTRDHQFSPAYVYNQINGGKNVPTKIDTALQLIVDQGVCSLKDMPYKAEDYTTKPNFTQRSKAAEYRGGSWIKFAQDESILDKIKQRLASQDAVVVNIPIGDNLYDLNRKNVSKVYDKVVNYKGKWHAICLIGYNDSFSRKVSGVFKFINSWGNKWGVQGYGYISYDFVIRLALHGYPSGKEIKKLGAYVMDAPTRKPRSTPVASSNQAGCQDILLSDNDEDLWHKSQNADGGWSEWELSGNDVTNIIADPAVGLNSDGRQEAFTIGPDGSLRHRWQTQPNGEWSNWESLGGVITADPDVCNNADGRLEVFARGTDNALWHIWQIKPNSGWSKWAPLGGEFIGKPAIGRNKDGRLEAFVIDPKGALQHIWQVKPNGSWSNWKSLGENQNLIGEPVVTNNADDRLEVFARGTDNALWHIWQTKPNNGWSKWVSLGGSFTDSPAVEQNKDRRLEAFGIGPDGALYHTWQIKPNGSWSDWTLLGGNLYGEPEVNNNKDGRLVVFVRGSDDAIWYSSQTASNSNVWSDWASLGGADLD